MYVEERMYTLKVGTAPEYLRHYQNEGMKVQLKHLPHMVGYYFTEVGTLNMIVHMWAYDSLDQRDKCRAAMSADADWQTYLTKIRPLMERQETRIMKCAPFFVERLKKMLAAVERVSIRRCRRFSIAARRRPRPPITPSLRFLRRAS